MEPSRLDRRLFHALILAAGEGRRLQALVQQLKNETLPKQYVNVIGRRSMLEHTFERAEKLIPAEQIVTVVGRHHLRHPDVRRQLAPRPPENIVVQPTNRETGPGILLPLMFVYKRCPEAVVAVFPSDHFILEESRFMQHVRIAAQAVAYDPARIVLLAIPPREPETAYGYIIPRSDLGNACPFGTLKIASFIEKPSTQLAFDLMKAGGLWNTMTMVFKLKRFLELVRGVRPALYILFRNILEALGSADEQKTIERVYQSLEAINFSAEIMEKIAARYPEALSVLPIHHVFWSDLGSRERVMQVRNALLRRTAEETNATLPHVEFYPRQSLRQTRLG